MYLVYYLEIRGLCLMKYFWNKENPNQLFLHLFLSKHNQGILLDKKIKQHSIEWKMKIYILLGFSSGATLEGGKGAVTP